MNWGLQLRHVLVVWVCSLLLLLCLGCRRPSHIVKSSHRRSALSCRWCCVVIESSHGALSCFASHVVVSSALTSYCVVALSLSLS